MRVQNTLAGRLGEAVKMFGEKAVRTGKGQSNYTRKEALALVMLQLVEKHNNYFQWLNDHEEYTAVVSDIAELAAKVFSEFPSNTHGGQCGTVMTLRIPYVKACLKELEQGFYRNDRKRQLTKRAEQLKAELKAIYDELQAA